MKKNIKKFWSEWWLECILVLIIASAVGCALVYGDAVQIQVQGRVEVHSKEGK